MLTIKDYVKVNTLEEAYELNQKKNNILIGGMLWLKMQDRNVNTIIDISGLGLDKIEETDDSFIIGAMTTLRQFETCKALNDYTEGAVKESVRHIVGVQFRNLATIGGSVYGRFGFSDVLTILMALNAQVKLYRHGLVPIDKFAEMKPDNDIVEAVIIPKKEIKIKYFSIRNSQTDFPILTCAAARINGTYRVAIGARPGRAVCYINDGSSTDDLAEQIMQEIKTEDNNRASADYRKKMAKVLTRRAINALDNGGIR